MALNLSYTTIAAPVDGTIGARWTFRASRNATDGSRHAIHVVANFKETQQGIIKRCWIVLSLLSRLSNRCLTLHIW
jgi:multidrug resistance efflux pump